MAERKIRVAINGFGRIGRLFFRQAKEEAFIEIVAVNDLGDLENLAYLLKYDSVYRRYPAEVGVDPEKKELIVNGQAIKFLQERDPAKLPWKDLGIDVVVESTGVFESYESARAHLLAGAGRVIITAPAKDEDGVGNKTVLVGINDGELHSCQLISNGSCTTNAASPVIAVMAENPGISKAILNTVHAYTATQNLVDGPAKGADMRRGRAAAENIVPSTTGAAIAVTRALPELEGKFDGVALRVPVLAGSIADITFLAKRKTSPEEINDIFRQAAASPRWQGILAVADDQLVSSDIVGEPFASIVDLRFTKVIDGDLVKVFAWYDNELGYTTTLVKQLRNLAEAL
jgi:glyceraldehyde 3-phosphate dehydrogenase